MNTLTNSSRHSRDVGNTEDGLVTYGVKLWNPDCREWVEVSVKGAAYAVNSGIEGLRGQALKPYYSNGRI
jgi:hypothetical protein